MAVEVSGKTAANRKRAGRKAKGNATAVAGATRPAASATTRAAEAARARAEAGANAPAPAPSSAPDAEHVTSVLRTLALLDAFRVEDDWLSLSALARRAGVPKTTAYRLARTLQSAGYLVQQQGGAWRLGPATARLASRYQTAFDLHDVIEPALQQLSQATGESVSFFAHDGNQRVRLGRVHGDHPFPSTTRIGEPLPLDRGSPGKVILAATGSTGALYDGIRARGYCVTVAEAQAGVASLAAAVYGRKRAVVGAICISMAASRAAKGTAVLERHAAAVVKAARTLSARLSAATSVEPIAGQAADAGGAPLQAHWHP